MLRHSKREPYAESYTTLTKKMQEDIPENYSGLGPSLGKMLQGFDSALLND